MEYVRIPDFPSDVFYPVSSGLENDARIHFSSNATHGFVAFEQHMVIFYRKDGSIRCSECSSIIRELVKCGLKK